MQIEILSLVNFNNQKRVPYLERSFGSFYNYKYDVQHYVMDSSNELGAQVDLYNKFKIDYTHSRNSFSKRLKDGINKIQGDYFLFYPDDYQWIFPFPLEDAIRQCRENEIAELKLACRGMNWFSTAGAKPEPWFHGSTVISGETLIPSDDLLISRRRWFFTRDFHEQFSLGCHLLNTKFARSVFNNMPDNLPSAAKCEIYAYRLLLFKRYLTAYYKMWIPAFHFLDMEVEAQNPKHLDFARVMLIDENIPVYNKIFNAYVKTA